ncbi:hypothetical protein BTUL_0077g00500 [Botrytis tulipae]|uniref:Uncharacterized protein n=1 Tax=Botrytis tulipae TaxID=87230 RepID=A0A4Z1EWG1_9HELO|nr:hypothetical protein BTUL_0077g00500 [Botrytis tulipae]
MSSWGDLVWQGPKSDPLSPVQYSNIQFQSLNGSEYLTYWNGYVLEGQNASIGYRNLTILDKHYEPAAVILSSVNGSAKGYLLDAQIHEIDIATSESIWKWSSLDHIPLNASQLPLTDMAANESVAWDYIHLNSVSPYGTDKLLNYNGIYGGDFGAVPEEATFRLRGSFDYLTNQQNATSRFMSYGQLPILREWQAGPGLNQTAFKRQATFGANNDVATYRTQKASWYGEPKTAPQLVVLHNGTAYMSWNGATHVAGWNIYSGSAENGTKYTLRRIARSCGFETAVDLGTGYYMVQPLMDFSPSMNATYGVNSTRVCSS